LTPGRYVGTADTAEEDEEFEETMTMLCEQLSALLMKSEKSKARLTDVIERVGFEL
jgi:type I restriction enzyme M protein